VVQLALPAHTAAEQQPWFLAQSVAWQGQHLVWKVVMEKSATIPAGQRMPFGFATVVTVATQRSASLPASYPASGGMQAGSVVHAGSAQSVFPLQSLSIPSVQWFASGDGRVSPTQGPNVPNSPLLMHAWDPSWQTPIPRVPSGPV
jgi:hypothetical protein